MFHILRGRTNLLLGRLAPEGCKIISALRSFAGIPLVFELNQGKYLGTRVPLRLWWEHPHETTALKPLPASGSGTLLQ